MPSTISSSLTVTTCTRSAWRMARFCSLSWAIEPVGDRVPRAVEHQVAGGERAVGVVDRARARLPTRGATGRCRGRRWRCRRAARRRSPAPRPCRSPARPRAARGWRCPGPACTRGSSKGWISTAPVSAMTLASVSGARRHGGLALDDARADACDGRELGRWHAARDHDRARDAALAGRRRERRGVVARAVGRHPARRLVVGQQQHGVGGAAELEGAGGVEVLGLEVHRGCRPSRRWPEPQHRCGRHREGDASRPPPAPPRTTARLTRLTPRWRSWWSGR